MYLSNENAELKSAKLFKEDSRYFLELRYEVENDRGLYEVIIPKMELPIRTNRTPFLATEQVSNFLLPRPDTVYASFGDFKLKLHSKDVKVKTIDGDDVVDNTCYLTNMIKEKKHKMTLSEVEKKLGYKIELVSEKEK